MLAVYVYLYDIALPKDFVASLLASLPETGADPAESIAALIEGQLSDDAIIACGDDVLEAYIENLRWRRNEIRRVEAERAEKEAEN